MKLSIIFLTVCSVSFLFAQSPKCGDIFKYNYKSAIKMNDVDSMERLYGYAYFHFTSQGFDDGELVYNVNCYYHYYDDFILYGDTTSTVQKDTVFYTYKYDFDGQLNSCNNAFFPDFDPSFDDSVSAFFDLGNAKRYVEYVRVYDYP